MKLKYLIGSLLIALTMGTLFTSCEKDDGSVGIEMRMRNYGNGGEDLYLLGGGVRLWIRSNNNFKVSDGEIVCVGNVGGIGRINNIPQSGWAKELAVHPGQGYIIRFGNKYARVYVVDWIEGTSGGIIGAIIRYQDNWRVE